MSAVFPLRPSVNGRYFVDQRGVAFRIHGEPSWDAHINLTRTDWLLYLADRQNKGITALHFYSMNALPYMTGANAPWMNELGGSGAGAAALPFLKNISGGTWDGDPTFTNFDADFSQPNDAYWAKVAQFVDDLAAKGMVAVMHYCYAGSSHVSIGDRDGWYKTMTNTGNTQTVCFNFGAYLANGHGTFTGFASRPNIIWMMQGDSKPANGAEGAIRMVKILSGLQANGCNQPVSQHIAGNTLPNDQADYSASYTAYCSYCSPVTYAEGRAVFGQSPVRPTFLIETDYWGETSGQTRAQLRYAIWGGALSCIGGAVNGFGPFWGFWTSVDGSGDGVPTAATLSTSWRASHSYQLNRYINHSGNWYRCTSPGTSAASGGPTGTGAAVIDGGVVWMFITTVSGNMQGMGNLLNEPGPLDHQVLGRFMLTIPWQHLVPSGLANMRTLVTAGGGTAATWTDGNPSSGGTDWIVSAQSDDGNCLVCYIPDAHSGSFAVDLSGINGSNPSAFWVDPVTGLRTSLGTRPRTSQSFTVPGVNAGGDSDWVLLFQISAGLLRAPGPSRGL